MNLKTMLAELGHQLEDACEISVEEIAAEVRDTGFQCLGCGDCCKGEENSVVVFPFEIRNIMSKTGERWLEVAEPPANGEWDSKGDFHTLEWRLKKNKGNCHYYSEVGCQIYAQRPMLCQTYPFYMDENKLICSECSGLSNSIGCELPSFASSFLRPLDRFREILGDNDKEYLKLASLIKKRQLIEIEEAMKLVSKYRDFRRGDPSLNGVCVVHDSEGEHRIEWTQVPGLLDRCLGNATD
ncbi:MAG: YkgJ family cysteine cluster protein [Methanotrichaceae archaeon]